MSSKSRRNGNRQQRSADIEATYVCDSCGEEIVVPVDG
jgi:ribosomal protein L32